MRDIAKSDARWTVDRVQEWYNKRPWIRGYCGYPSNCVNRIAMWQEYNHDKVFEQIENEFQLAKETGFNAVRAVIQFECWYYQHDSFMRNLEEYFQLAAKYGLGVMLVLGNDCTVPKSFFKPVEFGEQPVDWGYHSGIKNGPHAKDYKIPGYCLLDDPQFEPFYYKMVSEIAEKYSRDPRLQIWDIWNEPGNSNRKNLSLKAMEKFFEIVRSYDPIQPLTADVYLFNNEAMPTLDIEYRAFELSDIITFHNYQPYPQFVRVIQNLRAMTKRPIICNEWLNRLKGNDVETIFPLLWLENIGSYNWGLMAGFSQTYEPWGGYYEEYMREGSNFKLFKWQHDLYRFNGLPYDVDEIKLIKKFCALADDNFFKTNTDKQGEEYEQKM